jgi:hypothetical protein
VGARKVPTFASVFALTTADAAEPSGTAARVSLLCAGIFAASLSTACSERQKATPAFHPTEAPSAEPLPKVVPAAAERAKPVAAIHRDEVAPTTSESGPSGRRIYAKARFAWIQNAPRGSPGWIGYLSYGGSLALRGGSVEAARALGKGCDVWYAVEPIGYVCANESATLDAGDPIVKALAADAPDVTSPWPYQYAESLGAPRYRGIPSASDQKKNEWDLDRHEKQIELARSGGVLAKDLVGVDLEPAGVDAPALVAMSPLVRDERKFVAGGSTVAFTRSFDSGGRTFVVASDQAILPKDRVRPYPRSEFHGALLGDDVKLPLAFIRHADAPKLKKVDGKFEKTGETWPRLSHVEVTGTKVVIDFHTYWETKDNGLWAQEGDATVAELAKPPLGVSGSGRHTWVDVSILGGTLVAYEGERPVFATLISPGRGGIPFPGKDPLETASTPTGTFRVDGKFVTATMVSSTNDDLVHTEVEYVQNFHGPHALHGAYWHDRWGEPMSGGCVNLAPVDAKWLFDFSEPKMPSGWYGLRSTGDFGPATWVILHR